MITRSHREGQTDNTMEKEKGTKGLTMISKTQYRK
jgi:hypothetical protein